MYSKKILVGITGSIAAYKTAYLVSKLVQNGFEVRTAATDNALQFIGKATLEGLTGHRVYTGQFTDDEMMSHISLVKWADITLICPASANTINKMAAGIADNLITSLYLAHDRNKPYIIAPAMNTNMYNHPATRESIRMLEERGVTVLPTEEGYLACGDTGRGKLVEPDIILDKIKTLINGNVTQNSLMVLISSGATKESIDAVRFISNLSTGKTGAKIADYFIRKGHAVTFLHSAGSVMPELKCNLISYIDYSDYNEKIFHLLDEQKFDAIIHAAALSDYSIANITTKDENFAIAGRGKINSIMDTIVLELKRNQKIINKIKMIEAGKNIMLVTFKFTANENDSNISKMISEQIENSKSDYVVHNDIQNRNGNNQKRFDIYKTEGKINSTEDAVGLAIMLEKLLSETKEGIRV